MRLDITRQLAHALASAGIASLHYDKRGVGESAGSWKSAGLLDNVGDAGVALTTLATHPDVQRGAAFLVGHSEGAVLAAALGARETAAAGAALISASATPGELLLWQAAHIEPTLPLRSGPCFG